MNLLLHSSVRVLKEHRDFMRLFTGGAVSSVGDQITLIAAPAIVVAMTGSVTQTGYVGAVESAPFLAALFIGKLVDNYDRRRILVLTQFLSAFALASIPLAAVSGVLSMPQIFAVALVEGTAFAAFSVGQTSCLPFLLPTSKAVRAGSAATSAVASMAQMVGPAAGGLLIASMRGTAGPAAAYGADAASFLACGLLIASIRTPLANSGRHQQLRAWDGVRYILRHRQLRLIIGFSSLRALLVAPGLVLIYAQAHRLGIGAAGIGGLFSLAAFGALLASGLAVPIASRLPVRLVSIITNLLLATGFLMESIARNYGTLLAGELAFSMSFPILNSAQLAYRLTLVPDDCAGRVNAAARMAVYGCVPLGQTIGAALLGILGPSPVLAIVSICLVAGAVLTAISRLGQGESPQRPDPAASSTPGRDSIAAS